MTKQSHFRFGILQDKRGYEYKFTEGGVGEPCFPCWCCKRPAQSIDMPVSTATSAPRGQGDDVQVQPKKYTNHSIVVKGVSPAILVGEGGSIDGDQLTVSHGSGFTLFSAFEGEWRAESITELKLLGKSISFTVDLGQVGCACNLAFYLISSPTRDWNGQLSAGTDRDGQPPYYCDANDVGGQWCPEVDIMEANTHAFQATPHKCDVPTNGRYTNCDRGGCSQNTRDKRNAFGPGSSFTINTQETFEVRTEFPAESGVLKGMTTKLRQAGQEVVLDHSSCQAEYMAQLSNAMAAGMSLRI